MDRRHNEASLSTRAQMPSGASAVRSGETPSSVGDHQTGEDRSLITDVREARLRVGGVIGAIGGAPIGAFLGLGLAIATARVSSGHVAVVWLGSFVAGAVFGLLAGASLGLVAGASRPVTRVSWSGRLQWWCGTTLLGPAAVAGACYAWLFHTEPGLMVIVGPVVVLANFVMLLVLVRAWREK